LVLDLTREAKGWEFDSRAPTESRVRAFFRRAQAEGFRYAAILIGRYRQRKGQKSCPAVVRDVIRSRDSAPCIITTHHLRVGGAFLVEIRAGKDVEREQVLAAMRRMMRMLERGNTA
jgi:hypothetical protein